METHKQYILNEDTQSTLLLKLTYTRVLARILLWKLINTTFFGQTLLRNHKNTTVL